MEWDERIKDVLCVIIYALLFIGFTLWAAVAGYQAFTVAWHERQETKRMQQELLEYQYREMLRKKECTTADKRCMMLLVDQQEPKR